MTRSWGTIPVYSSPASPPPEVHADLWAHLIRGEAWTGELINRRRSGEVYWEEAHIAPVRDERGTITHYVAIKLNVTDRIQTQKRLIHMANHDVLTNLPNRSLFHERVEHALERAKRQTSRLAVMFIDLDRFKPVNDAWGHRVGDLLLQAVAERLRQRVRSADTLGRLGGDEFVVLLSDLASAEDASQVAEDLRLALAQPFAIEGHELAISASIGIALYPEHGATVDELTSHADGVMYRSKEDGRIRLDGLYHPLK